MKAVSLVILAGLALSACAPEVPSSNRTIGGDDFANFELERARREAAVSSGAPIVPPTATAAYPGAVSPAGTGVSATDLAAAGIGGSGAGAPLGAVPAANVTGPDSNRTAGVQASPSNAGSSLATANTAAISDEQSFEAVAERESIASDAARLAELRQEYSVVQPTALPERTDAGPNIVAYALNAPNSRGQEWYSRFMLSGQGRFERNCATFRSPDEAQREFLRRGGPERDPLGIDPDGDGFACGWDPAPFRAAVNRG